MDGTTVVIPPETTFFSYDKPLTPEAKATLASLMMRYTDDKGQPLVLFDSDPENQQEGWVALHVPRVMRPTFFEVAS